MDQPDAGRLEALIGRGEFAAVVAASDELARDADPKAALQRGVALVALGRPAEGAEWLERAEQGGVEAYLALHWKGKALTQLGRPARAAFAFRAAERLSPGSGNADLFAAQAFAALKGRTDVATRALLVDALTDLWREHKPDAALLASVETLTAQVVGLGDLLHAQDERLRDADLRRTWTKPFVLETDHPVALRSDDHLHPRGTATDNTRHPRFVRACEERFGRPLAALDLGCAGGGLVRDFLLRGHRAVGLEGSDHSLRGQRAEWRTLPRHLFTCDLLEPFALREPDGEPARFDVVTAWEVLEHLPRERLDVFFANVARHLAPDGLFVASVALFEDADPQTGAVWHVTLEPPSWWEGQMGRSGLASIASPFSPRDYARGSGNGGQDWDVVTQPQAGFHIVATHAARPG